MPLGEKALKKRQQNEDAKNGVCRDDIVVRKAALAKQGVDFVCSSGRIRVESWTDLLIIF
jgi:hypothetical protein